MGQSNALGADNRIFGYTYKSDRQPNDFVQRWNGSTFVPQFIGNGNYGCDVHYQLLATKLARPFYLIQSAKSSTAISVHLPPSGTQYLVAYNNVKNAINQLITEGKRPFVYIRWVQGENDSASSVNTNNYENRQITWLNHWRGIIPDVPVIIGGINVFGTPTEQARDLAINQSKINLANSGQVFFYDVTNLPTTDLLHRNGIGYKLEAEIVFNNMQLVEVTNLID
jgi:hypothetical protein